MAQLWGGSFLVATFTYTFDASYDINAFELWNDRGQIDSGIEDFELIFRDRSGASLGTFSGTAPIPSTTAATPQGEIVSFTAVPEPTTALLLSLGLAGLGMRRRG